MRDTFDLPRRTLRRLSAVWVTAAIVGGTLAGVAALPAPVAGAPGAVTLKVVDASSDPQALVTSYKWMINEDNTGTTATRNAKPGGPCSPWTDTAHTTPNPDYPGSCDWTSISGLETNAPVVAQGTQDDLDTGTPITLPEGRYLISVLADGFKLDGTPFSVPADGQVVVPLQPWPMPAATVKAQVFVDVTETNGQFDPGEDGIANFSGKIADSLGQVNTDVFGNPLCTKYAFNDQNGDGVQDPGEVTILDGDGAPTVTHEGGKCLSGDINMDGVVNGTDNTLYTAKGLDPTARPWRADDPQPRPEPLRPVPRSPDRLELDPDHDPRGQPRLGRLGDGGGHRLRHRVRGRWRAVPGHHLRLRPRADLGVLGRPRPQVPGERHRHDHRASSTRWTSTSR